jgi:hypothetical protein
MLSEPIWTFLRGVRGFCLCGFRVTGSLSGAFNPT